MTRFKGRRPSPAVVISIIALFVALGGGADETGADANRGFYIQIN